MTLGIAALTAGFLSGEDRPSAALVRALDAADRGLSDRAILWQVPGARAEAEAAGARWLRGAPRGPLDGVPLAVKDCIDVAGMPSTNGTSFLLRPVARDAAVVRRLRAAGAVIFAKTNMHELGLQPTGINPHHGTPVNPWDPMRIPGGSSSGSAVAVASGIAAAAIGTGAVGGVCIPAALGGLVGLKPTSGAVPGEGIARLTQDLDCAGPLAWTVDDAAALFEALAAVRLDPEARAERPALLGDFFLGAQHEVAQAVRAAIREAFGKVAELPSPRSRWAAAVEFVVVGTDAAEGLRELVQQHLGELGADTRLILRLGAGLPASDRVRADEVRAAMRAELSALLEQHDVLLAPAAGRLALPLRDAAKKSGELDARPRAELAAVSLPASLCGLPACSVPCAREGLPVGLQIIGRPGAEATVLAAARKVQALFPPRAPPRWHGAPRSP